MSAQPNYPLSIKGNLIVKPVVLALICISDARSYSSILSVSVMRLYAPTMGKSTPPLSSTLGSGAADACPTPFCPGMIMLPEGFG